MKTNGKAEEYSPKRAASIYRVCIAGTLPGGWENRFGGLQIVREGGNGPSNQTLLMGAVRDQAELLGIINTLHELRLPLLLVEAVDTDLCPCQAKSVKKRMKQTAFDLT